MDEFHAIYIQNENYVRKCLYWLLDRELVNDVVQEVFVKVWQKMDQFENKSSMKTWIYRIAMNTAYDHMRKEKKYISLETIDTAHATTEIESTSIHQELLKRAVGLLSAKQRIVFVLYYMEELSVQEVAQSAGISVGTVKSRLSSAREVMVTELKKHGVSL
jgi:RNA polymerase sigma-70 factor, ECF subfamily